MRYLRCIENSEGKNVSYPRTRWRPPGRSLDPPLKTAGASSSTNLPSTQIQLFFKVSLYTRIYLPKNIGNQEKNNNVETHLLYTTENMLINDNVSMSIEL